MDCRGNRLQVVTDFMEIYLGCNELGGGGGGRGTLAAGSITSTLYRVCGGSEAALSSERPLLIWKTSTAGDVLFSQKLITI